MKLIPEDKNKAYIFGGVIAVVLIAALYFWFGSGGSSKPDASTQAAQKKLDQMEANMGAQPPPAEIPLDQRAPRGAVRK
jgi:hypothetical protein